MNILIIGGGNMGLTYAQSFLRAHIVTTDQLMILEKSGERAIELEKRQLGQIFNRPEECLPKADLVILAVKPQDSSVLFGQLRQQMDAQQVVLSIMAGVKIVTISRGLGATKVIRAMPNLPAQIGQGMTVYTSSEQVTRIELVMVQNLLNTTGKSIYVEKEAAIDASTAISGSGPAYVWYFMDALTRAAREMGFPQSQAELLVSQTFQGAIALYKASDLSCEEWIKRVSSKGGTTEAAMASFLKTEVQKDIINGAKAALSRAKALGREGK